MGGVVVAGCQEPAVRFAAREARARACELTVVHSWTVPVTVAVESSAMPETDGLRATFVATGDGWAGALLGQDPDVVVVSRCRAGWLGPLGRRLLHLAGCTTVIVPEDGIGDLRRVVIGTNHSDAAEFAAQWAGAEAVAHDAPLARLQVQKGSPLDRLLAQVNCDDLLAVGHRHHSRLARAAHAHLAAELAALAPCPVAVVPLGLR